MRVGASDERDLLPDAFPGQQIDAVQDWLKALRRCRSDPHVTARILCLVCWLAERNLPFPPAKRVVRWLHGKETKPTAAVWTAGLIRFSQDRGEMFEVRRDDWNRRYFVPHEGALRAYQQGALTEREPR